MGAKAVLRWTRVVIGGAVAVGALRKGVLSRIGPASCTAALAPDDGEMSQGHLDRYPTTPIFAHVEVAEGRVWMLPDGIGDP
jgi:hypothetical protein